MAPADPAASDQTTAHSGLAEVGGTTGVANLVRDLVTIMRDGAVTELDLEVGPLSVRLRSKRTASPGGTIEAAGLPAATLLSGGAVEHLVNAPMIGTFYAAPSPGARPFIAVGDVIAAGQVVGIIEAMKIMNEITSDASGVVTAILVENGQPVEYGSPLISLTPTGE